MSALLDAPWYARTVVDGRTSERVAFEEDVLSYADDVWRVARRLARDVTEAEDLVQETYARAIRAWHSYESGTNLRAWLLRILHNLAIDQARKRQRSPEPEPLEEGDYYLYNRLEASGADAIDRLIDQLSQGPLLAALAALPTIFKEVVVLVDLGDFTYQEAADVLEVPIGTVMSRLHRGRRALKKALADGSVLA
jgi:RNA polymerase sigma-70 factor (ECF subfamily)